MIQDFATKARAATFILLQAEDGQVDHTLVDLASLLETKVDDIISANRLDLEEAARKGLSPALLDRLTLSPDRIGAMAESARAIAALDNPCGKILESWDRPNGLRIQKVSVPIGVIGMIYESRPNVSIDASALSLKSRNAIILRGGSDSVHSSRALHKLVQQALTKNGLPEDCVIMVPSQDRALVGDMLNAAGFIDVIIPRGGKSLTGRVMAEAKVPVFAHLDGNCHIYVHSSADREQALNVIQNAKLRRTGVCGAAESLLFDEKLDRSFAKQILQMLLDKDVIVVGDAQAQALDPRVLPATEEDWSAEYLDRKISCKFVGDYEHAVSHINKYGSHHTDSILSEDERATEYFLANVDSAIVMRNASTQFADGGEFGFGAEIGIGTGKLHARGPIGVRQLTTFKYRVLGEGQIRPV